MPRTANRTAARSAAAVSAAVNGNATDARAAAPIVDVKGGPTPAIVNGNAPAAPTPAPTPAIDPRAAGNAAHAARMAAGAAAASKIADAFAREAADDDTAGAAVELLTALYNRAARNARAAVKGGRVKGSKIDPAREADAARRMAARNVAASLAAVVALAGELSAAVNDCEAARGATGRGGVGAGMAADALTGIIDGKGAARARIVAMLAGA